MFWVVYYTLSIGAFLNKDEIFSMLSNVCAWTTVILNAKDRFFLYENGETFVSSDSFLREVLKGIYSFQIINGDPIWENQA